LFRPRCRGTRRDEVDRRLAPAGSLDDESTTTLDDERLDRAPLIVTQFGRWPGKGLQVMLGCGAQIVVHKSNETARFGQ
jgi:hypothetical protein